MKTYLLSFLLGIISIYPAISINQIDLSKTSVPPVLDGVLDDEAWKNAISYSDFKTWMPDFSKDMPQKTIAYVTYDEENLYFAFKCYDSEPDKIVGTITSRDGIRSEDWICINLDSQNDHQALYGIYVNPYGIQEDSRFAAGKEDLSTDLVWYSAGKIDEEGYVVEVQLPLKSIRFSAKSQLLWA